MNKPNGPAPRTYRCREDVRHNYTDAEIIIFSRELAHKHQRYQATEDAKGEVVARFKAELQEISACINSLSLKITQGYDLEPTDCEWRFHDPEPGMKTLYRLDTGKEVRSQAMDSFEKQERLFVEEEPSGEPTAEEIKGTVMEVGAENDAAPTEESWTPEAVQAVSNFVSAIQGENSLALHTGEPTRVIGTGPDGRNVVASRGKKGKAKGAGR